MELFTKLFGSLLLFVYHCFDRLVIHGYLWGLSRPEQVVYFFRHVVGVAAVDKEVLRRRTAHTRTGSRPLPATTAFPSSGPSRGCGRKTMLTALRPMVRSQRTASTSSSRAWSRVPPFVARCPSIRPRDPNYRILAPQRSRFTHYYFYIRDPVLGPIAMRVASFFPFHTTYYFNGHCFIENELNRPGIGFRKNDNAFLAVADPEPCRPPPTGSPRVIRERLEYWTLLLGPKFSDRERAP